MPETSSPPRSQPRPKDYVVVDGSDGPRRDFRISVGLREGWDAEGRVFDVSEAVRTARAWMRRRVEAGQPALSGMFTRAEVTYAWPREDGTVGSDREPVALFTGEAVHAYLGHLLGRRDRGDAERACGRTRRRLGAGAHLCRVRRPDLDPRRRGPRVGACCISVQSTASLAHPPPLVGAGWGGGSRRLSRLACSTYPTGRNVGATPLLCPPPQGGRSALPAELTSAPERQTRSPRAT